MNRKTHAPARLPAAIAAAFLVAPAVLTPATHAAQQPSASEAAGMSSAPAAAPARPDATGAAAEAGTMIPQGTPVFVSLKQSLRSGTARAGERVAFTVTSDVRRGGATAGPNAEVLIPAGTPAFGTVVQSHGAGAFGRPGRLRITCDYVLLPNGTRVLLRAIGPDNNKAASSSNSGGGAATNLHASGRSRRGAAITTMLVVGLPVYAVTFGIANLFGPNESAFQGQVVPALVGVGSALLVGSLWRGGNVTLPEGKTFAVEVAAPAATVPATVAPPAGTDGRPTDQP